MVVSKMSSSSTSNEVTSVSNEWESLQRDLNLDKETGRLAWKSYQEIRQNYTLEVNERHCRTIQEDWAFILQRKHREKKVPEWQRKAY